MLHRFERFLIIFTCMLCREWPHFDTIPGNRNMIKIMLNMYVDIIWCKWMHNEHMNSFIQEKKKTVALKFMVCGVHRIIFKTLILLVIETFV